MGPTGKLSDINPVKHATTLFDEFKSFAFKGNVVDLAIGVIIGGAFGKIVDSLVKNVIMPLISTITPGEKGYEGWIATINGVEIPYGQFLGEIVNFLIVALCAVHLHQEVLGLGDEGKAGGSKSGRTKADQRPGASDGDS